MCQQGEESREVARERLILKDHGSLWVFILVEGLRLEFTLQPNFQNTVLQLSPRTFSGRNGNMLPTPSGTRTEVSNPQDYSTDPWEAGVGSLCCGKTLTRKE